MVDIAVLFRKIWLICARYSPPPKKKKVFYDDRPRTIYMCSSIDTVKYIDLKSYRTLKEVTLAFRCICKRVEADRPSEPPAASFELLQ